jgi:hypothetical protein
MVLKQAGVSREAVVEAIPQRQILKMMRAFV